MLAIIPARSGSKGLPGKNVKELCGLPLIGYSIKAALDSKYISKVIVSTDCDKIYQISINLGADESFLRPSYLAEDNSMAIDSYVYTLERLAKEQGEIHDNFIVLQPTSPLRDSNFIDAAIELFHNKGADSVISVSQNPHPLHWSKKLSPDGKLSDVFENNTIQNRQEYEDTFTPNGAIYIFKSQLIKSGLYVSDNTFGYIMPAKSSVDIDTLEDFEYAEFLLRKKFREEKCSQ